MKIDAFEVNNGHVIAVFVTDKKRNMNHHKYEPSRARGEWVQVTAKDGQYYCYHKCTNCGQTIESGFDNPPLFNFCPQCGADMRKEGTET